MRKRHWFMKLLLLLVGLLMLIACRPDKKSDKTPKNDTTPKSDSKFYIERTPEPETYPPVTIVPGFILDEPDDVE